MNFERAAGLASGGDEMPATGDDGMAPIRTEARLHGLLDASMEHNPG